MMNYIPSYIWAKEKPFLTTNECDIIKRLENGEPTYEVTGSSDAVCKMYFDIDYKIGVKNRCDICYELEEHFSSEIDCKIKETGKKYIYDCIKEVLGVEPNIAVATSSCKEKYSWRYFVNNVKMNKNEMKEFIKTMNKYIEANSDIYDYIDNIGGLFDTGIYDNNRKMRCINTSKPNENRPLILVEGSIADTLITGSLDQACLVSYSVAPKIKIPTSPNSVADTSVLNEIDNDAISKLLKIIGTKNHTRQTWLTLCSWFVSNNTKKGFLEFVEPNWKEEAEKLFDEFVSNPRPCSVYAIHNIAKQINYDAYKKWRKEFSNFITLEIIDKGSNDVAQYVAPRLKEKLVYCLEKWYEFDKKSCLWRKTKKPDATIISHIQREIDEAKENLLYIKNNCDDDEELKKFAKIERRYIDEHASVSSGGYVSQIIKFLANYLCDDDFVKILDYHPYHIAFKNGMLDLRTNDFRSGLFQSDFLTKTIPYNYIKKQDTDQDVIDVRTALKKICNWNDDHLAYYLSCIGYAMIGDANKEQNFWYFRGQTAENGKSVVFEALERIMPNYVIKGVNTFLDKGAELKKEVPTWKGIRILWVNELSNKEKDEELVKSICDGTDFKYNRNYAEEAQKVSIWFKLFCVSNNSLSIKGDAGVARRFRLCQFNSQFQADTKVDDFENLQFIKSKTFGDDLCGIYRNALLHLIFNYSYEYCKEKCIKPYPNEWNEEAKENIADNNKFQAWFNDNFEIGKDFACAKKQFETMMPQELKNIKIRDELKRMKIIFDYKSQERITGYKEKGVFYGFKRKEEEEVKNA